MSSNEISDEDLAYLHSVTNKRARIVIDHILKYGHITTEEIYQYGYEHAPRAVRDVREFGIPLITYRVPNSTGTKKIAAYKFGDLTTINKAKNGGRSTFPKEFNDKLYALQEGKCSICYTQFEDRYMQVDHKIPYEVIGSKLDTVLHFSDFQLLCPPCNRAKSWSCEHCVNWIGKKVPEICINCYWANPLEYTHVALREMRRADITWVGDEIKVYEQLKKEALENKIDLPNFVKEILQKYK
jgi:hypothetical protein